MKIFFTLNLTLSFAGTPWQSCDKRYTCRAIIPGLSCAWITRLHSKNKIYRRLPENVERRAWTCDFLSNSLINGWKCAQVQFFFFLFFFSSLIRILSIPRLHPICLWSIELQCLGGCWRNTLKISIMVVLIPAFSQGIPVTRRVLS